MRGERHLRVETCREGSACFASVPAHDFGKAAPTPRAYPLTISISEFAGFVPAAGASAPVQPLLPRPAVAWGAALPRRGMSRGDRPLPTPARWCYNNAMTLTARVQNGRLVLDEPTTLPEGQVVQLEVIRGDWANEQNWSPAVRDALENALDRGSADVAAGRTVDVREFLAALPERA